MDFYIMSRDSAVAKWQDDNLKILNENEILSILESENLYSSLSDSQILQKSVKKPQK